VPDAPASITQAAVLCGGRGTRLRAVTGEGVPKVLVDVCGRPLLAYHLDLLRRHGVAEVVLCTGHLGEVVEAWVRRAAPEGLRVRCVREPRPLGTAGTLARVRGDLAERLFVLYGDVLARVDLGRMAAFHRERGGEATLLTHPSDHPYDSDLVEADPATGRITAFPGRPGPGEPFVNRTSAGLYVLERRILEHVPADRPSDFGRDVFPARLAAGAALFAYDSDEFARDLGTPERWARVCEDVRKGRV